MPTFKNPSQLQKSFTSNDDKYREELKGLNIPENEWDSYLEKIGQSEREKSARDLANKEINKWKQQNEAKPRSSSLEQLDKIRKQAIKEFGLTDRYENAFYMLPNGKMLNGSGGNPYGRYIDHREINSPYLNAGVELYEEDQGGNTTNMLDFMRGGHIRMIPESNSIDIMSKPTSEQLNNIYRMFRLGKLDSIQISNPNDKYGQQLDYLEDIRNERQIADFINKHFR